ncbi:hypothetical protein BDW71DRAFT_51728 [Aspergillus fruticulosus]
MSQTNRQLSSLLGLSKDSGILSARVCSNHGQLSRERTYDSADYRMSWRPGYEFKARNRIHRLYELHLTVRYAPDRLGSRVLLFFDQIGGLEIFRSRKTPSYYLKMQRLQFSRSRSIALWVGPLYSKITLPYGFLIRCFNNAIAPSCPTRFCGRGHWCIFSVSCAQAPIRLERREPEEFSP